MNDDLTIKDNSIRYIYEEDSKRYYFSVIDVVAIVTESSNPRNYWKVLKSRLNKANPELVTKCNQLKMPSSDGKSYLTDVADSDSMIEIVNTISSKYTNQLELYFEKIETTYPHSKEISLKNLEEVEDIELPLDLYQDDSNIIIESLVAGSQIEDIFISVNYKNVTIKGKRIIPQEKQNYLLQEIYWGVFSRNILLPAEIQIDKVEATISHGFLTIKLPKIDTKRNRIIKIKSI